MSLLPSGVRALTSENPATALLTQPVQGNMNQASIPFSQLRLPSHPVPAKVSPALSVLP